jgi:hypothetical protein
MARRKKSLGGTPAAHRAAGVYHAKRFRKDVQWIERVLLNPFPGGSYQCGDALQRLVDAAVEIGKERAHGKKYLAGHKTLRRIEALVRRRCMVKDHTR